MVRRLLWKEATEAVKLSSEFKDFNKFHEELERTLHYNSSYIRKRNASSIFRWFFPSKSLDNLLTKCWRAYRNDQLIIELMRYQYLTVEQDVADFVVNHLLRMPYDACITKEDFNDFLLKSYGVIRTDPFNSLRGAVKNMGFLFGENKTLSINQIPIPKTSLILLTHYKFAKNPSIVTIKEILSDPYWKYLGIREAQTVRQIMREADALGIFSKYVIADQLEQITTKYSFEELISRKTTL